jgi:NitT/TauT family transport system ATP-binding protein
MAVMRLAMADFVDEVRRLCRSGPDPAAMQSFLTRSEIEPASLEPYVRFQRDRYTRHLVHKDREVEVLVLCWAAGARAPIHGHEGELCWARVERGRLRFTSYRAVSHAPVRLVALGNLVEGGPGHVDGPADIHAVENPPERGEDAVSLHVYSRPYDECDLYDSVEARCGECACSTIPARHISSLSSPEAHGGGDHTGSHLAEEAFQCVEASRLSITSRHRPRTLKSEHPPCNLSES